MPTPIIFTVLAYRENFTSWRNLSEPRQYDSEFLFKVFPSLELAAAFWAQKQFEDHNDAKGLPDWELTLLVNGSDDHSVEFDAITELSRPLLAELVSAADAKVDKEKAAVISAAQARETELEKIRAAAQEIIDLAEFQRLTAKFKPNT